MGKTANVGPIKWDEANIYFNRLEKKWKNIDGEDFNPQDFHVLKRMIFNMCMQKEPHNYRNRLYDKYLELSELYILVKIFPCFESKNGEVLVRKAIAVFQALESRIDPLISLFGCLDRAKPGSLLEASRQIFVEKFLARNAIVLHSRYAEYVEICFNNHYIFDKAFSEVMEELCNNAKNAMGKSLVIFCNKLLEKGGSEKPIDEDIEKTLEKAVHLLSFIRNEDFYAKFYRQTLARRLLLGLSANEEHEIFILTKLKKHFGWHFTNKMERMILDCSLSKELQKAYDKYLSGNPPADPGIDLTVNILTKGIWPVFPAYDLRLPTELVKCAEVYMQHYNSTMTRRKISWMNSLGTCTIRVNWEGETRELVVTACQASLLWLFNNNDTLNYSEIVAGLNFKGDVISLLYSLIHEDFNILKKIPPSDYISTTDSFEFNGHFSDKRENMMITFRGIEKGNAQDWSDTIDACIMRVMKQARILESDQLMKLCAAELSRMFKLNSRTFGIQIAGLIHQGFLERDGDRYSVLKYVTD